MATGGISFIEGRDEVLCALGTIELERKGTGENRKTTIKQIFLFLLLPIVSALILVISGTVQPSIGAQITGAIVVVLSAVNALLVFRTSRQEFFELNKVCSSSISTFLPSFYFPP